MFTVTKRAQTEIRTLLREDLTLEQYNIIRYIRIKGNCISTELADVFGVGKSAITSIIAKLADKQLLRRIPEVSDRRIIRLELTKEGHDLSLQTERLIEQWLSSYLVHFSTEEAETFIRSFEKLALLVSIEDKGSGRS